MFKYSILAVIILVQACNTASDQPSSVQMGSFKAAHYRPETDHAATFMMSPYQNLLMGLNRRDTNYLATTATHFIQMNDSLAAMPMQLDSNLQQLWVVGLGNINAELQGLLAAIATNDIQEISMSVHMTSLQFLHLLGQIGYKEHSVYLFNSAGENREEGYIWMGFQKNSKDPFQPQQKKEAVAIQLLEESK